MIEYRATTGRTCPACKLESEPEDGPVMECRHCGKRSISELWGHVFLGEKTVSEGYVRHHRPSGQLHEIATACRLHDAETDLPIGRFGVMAALNSLPEGTLARIIVEVVRVPSEGEITKWDLWTPNGRALHPFESCHAEHCSDQDTARDGAHRQDQEN